MLTARKHVCYCFRYLVAVPRELEAGAPHRAPDVQCPRPPDAQVRRPVRHEGRDALRVADHAAQAAVCQRNARRPCRKGKEGVRRGSGGGQEGVRWKPPKSKVGRSRLKAARS
eukprot:1189415-Prorocentrum_minimum.AAC.6